MRHVKHTGRTRGRGGVARKRKEGSYFENPPQGNGGTIDDLNPENMTCTTYHTYMNVSCFRYERVMFQIWNCHVSDMFTTYHTYMKVWKRHNSDMKVPCFWYESVMFQTCSRHALRIWVFWRFMRMPNKVWVTVCVFGLSKRLWCCTQAYDGQWINDEWKKSSNSTMTKTTKHKTLDSSESFH